MQLRLPCSSQMPQTVIQAFEIYLPQAVRSEYDKIFATENEQESSKCGLLLLLLPTRSSRRFLIFIAGAR